MSHREHPSVYRYRTREVKRLAQSYIVCSVRLMDIFCYSHSVLGISLRVLSVCSFFHFSLYLSLWIPLASVGKQCSLGNSM